MDLRQRTEIAGHQKMVMSPHLLQSLEILALPLQELSLKIEREILLNPVLEEDLPADAPAESAEQIEPPAGPDDYLSRLTGGDYQEDGGSASLLDSIPGEGQRLGEYLVSQLHIYGPENIALGEFIIGNIDDDGYLCMEIEEIASSRGVSLEEAESMLRLIQSFDPPGACARDLRECLLLQAAASPERNRLAEKIIKDFLPELRKKQLVRIASGLHVSRSEAAEAVRFISKLTPRPGASFASGSSQAIFPDVVIEKTPGGYSVSVEGAGLPGLRISRFYRRLMKNSPRDVRSFIRKKIKSAEMLLDAIAGRKDSLRKISECILEAQKEFFEGDAAGPSPLRMKEAARRTGLSESTVSRAVSGKYIETDRGIFPMKYFFTGTASPAGPGGVSAALVKERIAALVKEESPDKPLSDGEIVSVLKSEGITIARRTAAKYRESAGILPAPCRKAI